MVAPLEVDLLGPPVLKLAGKPIGHVRRKTVALVAYLALNPPPHSRDALAALLWPSRGQSAARANLRRALSALRRLAGPQVVVSEQETVQLGRERVRTDVGRFLALARACVDHRPEQACERCLSRLRQAEAVYRNDLLFGFALPDCTEFDHWQFLEGEQLRDVLASVLRRLAAAPEGAASGDLALRCARRLLSLDPLEESAHRLLIRLYARSGQRSAAIRQYRECLRLLKQELGAEPEAETLALHEALQAGRLGARVRRGQPEESASSAARPREPEPSEAPVDELRLVSVLALGFSPWEESDRGDEPTTETLQLQRWRQRTRELLQDARADVHETSPLDLLAVFGWPEAYEDDAERAVRCALELVGEPQGGGLSAGVDTGISYVSAPRGPAPAALPSGTAVSRALRLRYRAAPGSVLVSAATHRHTRNAFRYEAQALQLSAGPPERVYRLLGPAAQVRKPYGIEGLQADTVGREAELGSLAEAWRRAAGGQGQLVSVVGEAGVGKSRLLQEFQKRAQRAGQPLWLEGRCRELGTARAYFPVLEILRGYFGFQPGEGEGKRTGRITKALDGLVQQKSLAAADLEEIGPILGRLFALRFGTPWDRRLTRVDPAQLKHRTLRALVRLFGALCVPAPTVLVLEDLHWSDSLSIELAHQLIDELPGRRLLLVCLHRPASGQASESLALAAGRRCPEGCTTLRLEALGRADTDRLVCSLLDVETLPPAFLDPIHRRSQGNPFYVEEILRTQIDQGLLRRDAGGWQLPSEPQGQAAQPAPQGLLALIQSRCDRLRPGTRRLAQTAAAVGEQFALPLLQATAEHVSDRHAADRHPADLEDSIRELTGAALIYPEPPLEERRYAFRHALVRESIYAGLPPQRRRELHGRIAEAIEALHRADRAGHYGELAYHYERGDRPRKAIDYLLKAGEKARRSCDPKEAVRCFEGALALLEKGGSSPWRQRRQITALVGLGRIHEVAGRLEAMEGCFRRAIALGRAVGLEGRALVRLYHGLGVALHHQNRHEELGALAREGLSLLGTRPATAEAALMNGLLAYYYGPIDHDRYLECVRRNAGLVDRLPYGEELVPAYVEVIWAEGSWGEAEAVRRWCALLERKARAQHDLKAEILARLYAAIFLHFRSGDLRGAVRLLLENLDPIERSGYLQAKCHDVVYLAWIYEWLGELEQAERWNKEIVELCRELGHRERYADVHLNWATVTLSRGRRAEGLALLDKAAVLYRMYDSSLDSDSMVGMPSEEGRSRGAIWGNMAGANLSKVGMAYLAAGERERGVAALREAFDIALRPKAEWQNLGVMAIGAMEQALRDCRVFRSWCRECRRRSRITSAVTMRQWHLQPARRASFGDHPVVVSFADELPAGWQWVDPCGDGSCRANGVLELRAPNGRDLWFRNLSAPRLLLPVEGDFAAEVACSPAVQDRPAMGGLLLWQDDGNFLQVERGSTGPAQLTFRGHLDGEFQFFGRGMLAGRILHLRLERRAAGIRALCSPGGGRWYTLGTVEASFDRSVHLGLFAIGLIPRILYQGAFPEGTAIRFESLRLWRS